MKEIISEQLDQVSGGNVANRTKHVGKHITNRNSVSKARDWARGSGPTNKRPSGSGTCTGGRR